MKLIEFLKTYKLLFLILSVSFLAILFLFFLVSIYSMKDLFPKEPIHYTTLDKYEQALNAIWKQKCVEHFPKSIPKNAKNIQFNQEQNEWFGSEVITLKFNIDKKFIDRELKKYAFKYKENVDNFKQKEYSSHKPDAMMTDGNRIKTEGFILYIINDRESEKPAQNRFPYHYGIAVNDDLSEIIYYYTCSD